MAPVFPQTFGPFKGMRYCLDPDRRDPSFALLAQDMIVADPLMGGAYYRRPSDQYIEVKAASATTFQLMDVFRKRSGFIGVAVVDGEIYTLSGTTWTRQVTTANLTSASVTLSATTRVFGITYNNTYAFNDGVNQPFTWNGVAGAGGLVPLTNTPSKCYGKPFVHYAKLGFIKDVAANSADRDTIVWSEENAANTGYEAGGYNNVWTLNQNGQGGLYACVGTDSGLYYWRRDKIGVIRGAITSQFTTSGVHDSVSSIIGTTCPDVLWYEGYLYFLDGRGRPWRFPENGALDPLYLDLVDLYNSTDTPGSGLLFESSNYDPTNSNVAPFPWVDGVVFGVGNSQLARQQISWLFSHRSGRCQCRISPQPQTNGHDAKITGTTYDSTNGRTVLAFGGLTAGVAHSYVCPVISGSYFDTGDLGGRVTRQIIVGPFGSGPEAAWDFSRYAVTLNIGATASPQTGTVETWYSTTESPYDNFTEHTNKTAVSQTYTTQTRLAWGIQQHLRWLTVRIRDAGGFEGWGPYSVTTMASPSQLEADKT